MITNIETLVGQSFNVAYDNVPEITFNPKWNNGTGYFDGAVDYDDAPVLAVGEVVRSVTPEPNNRKILIVGTPVGNVVAFQRYTNRNDVHVYCSSTAFNRIAGNALGRPLCAEDIDRLFNAKENIGLWIANSTDPNVLRHVDAYKTMMTEDIVEAA